jgi:hypothetical protein
MTPAPAWLSGLAADIAVNGSMVPFARLADVMRSHGEDPADRHLWHLREAQLVILAADCDHPGRPCPDTCPCPCETCMPRFAPEP